MELLGVVPRFDQTVAHGVAGGLVSTEVVEVESGASECVLHVVDDRALDRLLVVAHVRAHQLPDLLGAFPTMTHEFGTVELLIFCLAAKFEFGIAPFNRLGLGNFLLLERGSGFGLPAQIEVVDNVILRGFNVCFFGCGGFLELLVCFLGHF